jgi:bifunctional ADP-heptose synthase (sugar kinase/adenylyltransferase)
MVSQSNRTTIAIDTSMMEVLESLRSNGASIGFVFGQFHLLHPGSLHMLRMAAERCDVLMVGIWSDLAYHHAYQRPPVFPEMERSIMLGFYSMVSAVIPFAPEDLHTLIDSIKPDKVFVKRGSMFIPSIRDTYKLCQINPHGDYSSRSIPSYFQSKIISES